jgi:hypothetical protein
LRAASSILCAVADQSFDASHANLLVALDEAVALLIEHGEHRWAAWLADDRQRIERGDRYGISHLLQAFGGMGSLNDLMFHPVNGNAQDAEEGERATAALRRLNNRVWTEATALQRALDRS